MNWLDEIEKRCFPSEDSDDPALAPTWDQARKLVTAVRLAERGFRMLEKTGDSQVARIFARTYANRLCSGDVEEKS